MIRWRIYYSDGTTFSSNDGRPEDAPGWGVVAIPQEDHATGRMIMSRWDHYCWHDDPETGGQWWGHDITGLLDCLALPGANVVLHGRTVSSPTFDRIMSEAVDDPDFPVKTARASYEERGG